MGFLIPTARPNPTLLGRFGRLLHWTALGWAVLLLLASCFAASAFSTVSPGGPPKAALREVWIFSAVVIALIGRAARYLFAGE